MVKARVAVLGSATPMAAPGTAGTASATAAPYDEVYWRGEGETQEGYGFVSDNSGSYTSYYTGWGYWN
jgi:hypothetical protein